MSILKATISVRDRIEIPSPIVGDNGNWWEWDSAAETFKDTGCKAKGEDGKDVDPAKLNEILKKLEHAGKAIDELERITEYLQEGKLDIDALPLQIRWLLDAFNQGETTIAGGLLLTRIIGLSNQDGRISAYLSGYNSGDGKVLRAGVDTQYELIRQLPLRDYLVEFGCDLSSFPGQEGRAELKSFVSWVKKFPRAWQKIDNALKNPSGDVRLPFDLKSSMVKLADEVKLYGYKPLGTEKVAIYHDGRGHFGDIYLNGNVIDYKFSQNDKPYLSVGSPDATFIDDFVSENHYDDIPIQENKVELDTTKTTFSRSFDAPADGTSITLTLDKLKAEVYKNAIPSPSADRKTPESHLVLSIDGKTLDSWQGKESLEFIVEPSNPFDPTSPTSGRHVLHQNPQEASDLHYTQYVSKGRHTLKIAIEGNNGGKASIEGVKLSRYYDSGATQTYIRGSGLRFFGSVDRYVDIDYRDRLWRESNLSLGEMSDPSRYQMTNPYTMRIKGGLKVDRIEAEELDMPGCVLCGGAVKNGAVYNSFGKYKNKNGNPYPVAIFDKNTRIYRVHHSIGHTKYVPMITMAQGEWADLPHIVSVDSYSFDVKFINSENVASQWNWDFNYICYKGE